MNKFIAAEVGGTAVGAVFAFALTGELWFALIIWAISLTIMRAIAIVVDLVMS